MTNNKGDVKPCSKWVKEGKDELPGYRYDPGAGNELGSWDFPCITYDATNQTSRKAAMLAALNTGLEEMNRLRAEVEEDVNREAFKKAVQREKYDDKM